MQYIKRLIPKNHYQNVIALSKIKNSAATTTYTFDERINCILQTTFAPTSSVTFLKCVNGNIK